MASLGNKNPYWILKTMNCVEILDLLLPPHPPTPKPFLLHLPTSNCLINPKCCTGFDPHGSFHKLLLPTKTTWIFCLGSLLLLQQTESVHRGIRWVSEQTNMQPGLQKREKDLNILSYPSWEQEVLRSSTGEPLHYVLPATKNHIKTYLNIA